MFRTLLLASLFAAVAVAAVPSASACCHLIGDHKDVGPCFVEWQGNLVFGGGENYFDYVTAECSAGGQTVSHTERDVCVTNCP